MTAYIRVHREYLGMVIAKLKKVNGVKIMRGTDLDSQIQTIKATSRLKDDLKWCLEDIESNEYLCYEYHTRG